MIANRASAKALPADWRDHYWWSDDGVRLHTRIYEPARPAKGPPLICLPGLTRNARDFEKLSPHLAKRRRVYALNIRGRADSGYARDAMSYTPLTYVQDLTALLDAEGIDRFIAIGTSLGGLMTMLIAAMQPGRVAAAVLNDIGPQVEPSGIERIAGYVGQGTSYPTWMHAARAIAAANQPVYPDWSLEQWLVLVKRSHRLTPEGRIIPDYDSNIAQPFRLPGGAGAADLWPAFAALKSVPLLVVRGALSDILSARTAKRMVEKSEQASLVTIARVGHAPTLDEPAAVAAIDALVASVPA